MAAERTTTTSRERAKRPKDRADRILAASARLFRERGFHGVGIDDIGAAVGITGPALYRHFRSKDALLVALVMQAVERLQTRVEQCLADVDGPEDAVRGVVELITRSGLEYRDLSAIFLREARHIPPADRVGPAATERRLTDRFVSVLRELRPGLGADEARFMARAMVGIVGSLIQHASALPRQEQEALFVRMAMASLLGGRPVIARRRARRAGAATASREAAVETERRSRREAILVEAAGLFRRHGFNGIGIDEIGAAAGITGPAVYRHFKNKEDLLVAMFSRAGEQMTVGLEAALSEPRNPDEALERLVSSYVGVALENRDLIAIYMYESNALSPQRQADLRRRQRLYIQQWVDVLLARRPDLAVEVARDAVHAAIGVVNTGSLQKTALPADVQHELLLTMALAALSAA